MKWLFISSREVFTNQTKILKPLLSLKSHIKLKMSTPTLLKTFLIAAAEKKRSAPKKRLILIEETAAAPQEPTVQEPTAQRSIWMQMRRAPKVKTSFIWEGVEDISDDEDDTPQAAGRRLSQMKATRDRMQYKHSVNRLEDLQDAGLFLNW